MDTALRNVAHLDELLTSASPQAQRDAVWRRMDQRVAPLCEEFAWAIPDQRALGILQHFAPLVEIGAGKGYWAALLRARGVNILCYDRCRPSQRQWTYVQCAGPQILRRSYMHRRNLLLCYPDDRGNLALRCLQHFCGQHVIHVGELISTGTYSGFPQAPFGRTTGSDFQVALMEQFHCLLVAPLPSLPFANDYITVWKRTTFVPGRSLADGSQQSEDGGDDEDEDRNYWAEIPEEERLRHCIAVPALTCLLSPAHAT